MTVNRVNLIDWLVDEEVIFVRDFCPPKEMHCCTFCWNSVGLKK